MLFNTDRQTDMTNLTVAFRYFEKAPKYYMTEARLWKFRLTELLTDFFSVRQGEVCALFRHSYTCVAVGVGWGFPHL